MSRIVVGRWGAEGCLPPADVTDSFIRLQNALVGKAHEIYSNRNRREMIVVFSAVFNLQWAILVKNESKI